MPRVYKSVRLAYEAKVWINDLIAWRAEILQNELKDGLNSRLEDEIFELNPEVLNGVSVNLVLKVTNGSVIEQAVRNTKHYDVTKWRQVARDMESAIKSIKNVNVEDITPRLYLKVDILDELERLRLKLKVDDSIPRLSYVIKLVVFALHNELKI